MALSASSMADAVESHMAAVSAAQVVGAGSISTYRNTLLQALCQGIIDEITAHGVVHTLDSRGDTCNNGTIT